MRKPGDTPFSEYEQEALRQRVVEKVKPALKNYFQAADTCIASIRSGNTFINEAFGEQVERGDLISDAHFSAAFMQLHDALHGALMDEGLAHKNAKRMASTLVVSLTKNTRRYVCSLKAQKTMEHPLF